MANWYRNFKKSQQTDDMAGNIPQEMSRYRGVMVYEVSVPAGDKTNEQAAASQAAQDLYSRIFSTVGDAVPTFEPPEFYGRSPR
jgi:ABC-type microcin C transport system permease subunit YejB